MSDLETIVEAVFIGSMLTLTFGVLPLASFMYVYARNYNLGKIGEFLIKEFGQENLEKIEFGEQVYDQKRKNVILLPLKLKNRNYTLELEYLRSTLFADLFYDTRLYEPVKLLSK